MKYNYTIILLLSTIYNFIEILGQPVKSILLDLMQFYELLPALILFYVSTYSLSKEEFFLKISIILDY